MSTTSSPLLPSPSISYSTSHSDHSNSSRPTSPSTAPSTPSNAPTTHYIFTSAPPAALLSKLSVQASTDRVLVFTGAGKVMEMLAQAEEILGENNLTCKSKWELAQSEDGVAYYVTTQLVDEGVDLAGLNVVSAEMSEASMTTLATACNLRFIISLPSASSTLALHVLERPSFLFPSLTRPNPYALPTPAEFAAVWRAWDTITLGMIPSSLLHVQPISLRHKPLFYIGHLPTFNALLLTKELGVRMVEPRAYARIFERGIDPDVDDPTQVHGHSEVPERDEDWPTLPEVLAFRDRVRDLVLKTLREMETGERRATRRLVRTLMMMHEHEGFHLETLLYILLQSRATLPPPGFAAPPFALLAQQWARVPAPATPYAIIEGTMVLGHDDQEPSDLVDPQLDGAHKFGWDNESPRREVYVRRVRMEWRPISNAEFYAFWHAHEHDIEMPKSWVLEDGEVKVKTFYGPQPLAVAGTWPCLASYDALLTFAQSRGGRLPSEPELRLFLDRYNIGYDEGANTGFRRWHPTAPTAGLVENNGRGSNGGAWEWTSTPFSTHEGFEGTTIFPGYSSDFFDGKHMIVLGASYATIPRLGERCMLRNFYQHNYPYPWVAARVCYDM